MVQARNVAKGYARNRGKQYDKAFIDECIAEAWFIVIEMYWTSYDAIVQKYPDQEERFKFVRMSVGYKLKEYWAYRPTSTMSYLKKKGISTEHIVLKEEHAIEHYSKLGEYIALEHAVRNQIEARVIELYSFGNDRELIASKLSMTVRRVRRILLRVKKRLLRSNLSS